MHYKSVTATRRGGPEVLEIIERELRPPADGEARLRILATPVCQDDIAVRKGNRPFLAKTPFIPGYSTLGVVDAVGSGVQDVKVGDRVVALTNFGGYAEYIYLDASQLAHVPGSLDPAAAAVLTLNYLVAYQVLHRVAEVQPGDKILIIGASGGVGTALLQLGRLADLSMYGIASKEKAKLLAEYGATPIDYRTQDFVEVIRAAEPDGLNYVFNGMGEEYFRGGLAVLKRGGSVVHYGGPESLGHFVRLVAELIFYNLLPNGKKIHGYGTHRLGTDLFKEDWATLFELLEEHKIEPIIMQKYPILEAAQANAQLESGSVEGNLVLVAPELL